LSVGCAWWVERITPDALVAAEAALLPSEREMLAGFKFEKRRQEWLMGRWALKHAAAGALGSGWLPGALAIARNEKGAPALESSPGLPPGVCLSLTHSHAWVGAVAAPWAVGLDLERLRQMPAGGWRYYLSPAERDWLAEKPWGPSSDIIAWSLKEAAFKAWGGRSRSLVPLTLLPEGGDACRLVYEDDQVWARWALGAGMCVALAAAPAGASWLNQVNMHTLLPVAEWV